MRACLLLLTVRTEHWPFQRLAADQAKNPLGSIDGTLEARESRGNL